MVWSHTVYWKMTGVQGTLYWASHPKQNITEASVFLKIGFSGLRFWCRGQEARWSVVPAEEDIRLTITMLITKTSNNVCVCGRRKRCNANRCIYAYIKPIWTFVKLLTKCSTGLDISLSYSRVWVLPCGRPQ